MGFISMDKIKFPILATTLYMLLYNLFPFLGVSYTIIASMFLMSPIITIWMVVKVLREGVASEKTFDSHWYEDQPV